MNIRTLVPKMHASAVADTATANGNAARVLAAKLDILAKQWFIIGVVHLAVASITAIILWRSAPTAHAKILGWYAVALLLTLLRLSLLRYFGTGPTGAVKAKTRAVIYLLIAVLSGLFWGMLAVLFLDLENIALSAFIICLLIGMTAGALPSMAALVPVYYAFATPLVLLLSTKLALDTGTELYWLMVLILAFWLASLLFARNLQQTITTSITTDLRNAQLLAEITAAKEQAEQANLAKSRFLAAASHDLRQPLHAMGLFLDTLRDRLDGAGAADKKLLDNIASAHAALESLFNALLEISKLDSGAVEPQPSHFELSPLLQELCQEFAAEAALKGLTLTLQGRDEIVYTDPLLLNRIVRNLISNAVHYTKVGHIAVIVETFDQRVRISVEDSGIGIPEAELDNIFSEYHQLDNVERDRNKGLGLGLAVVRRMAELLEHPLAVRSQTDRGSVFSIEVPVGDSASIPCEQEPAVNQSLAGKRVIVIDDEQPILEGMKSLLAKWGCQVMTAESSTEAIAHLKQVSSGSQPDIIVTDYRLRKEDTGIKTIEAIRQHCQRAVPALLISGDTDRELLKAIRQQGFYLLHKPIKPAHLHKAMSDLLRFDAMS